MNNAERLKELLAEFHVAEDNLRDFLSSIGEGISGPNGKKATGSLLVNVAQRKLDTFKNLLKPYDKQTIQHPTKR